MNTVDHRNRLRTLIFNAGPFCLICDRLVTRPARTLDHITPRAHGGSDRLANLGLAHLQCNHDKADGPLIQRRPPAPRR